MYYFLQFPRRTAFWGLMALLVNVFVFKVKFSYMFHCATSPVGGLLDLFFAYCFWSLVAWPILVGVHLLVCKIRDSFQYDGFWGALGYDVVFPFASTILIIKLIITRHEIDDDSAFHIFEDGLQVAFGGLWTIVLIAFLTYGFLSLAK